MGYAAGMLPTLYELLDDIDDIAASGNAITAAQRLADLLPLAQNTLVRSEVEAYLRAYGFVVRPDECPPVQLPGVYDPQTIDAIEQHLCECSDYEREHAHANYAASLYP